MDSRVQCTNIFAFLSNLRERFVIHLQSEENTFNILAYIDILYSSTLQLGLALRFCRVLCHLSSTALPLLWDFFVLP